MILQWGHSNWRNCIPNTLNKYCGSSLLFDIIHYVIINATSLNSYGNVWTEVFEDYCRPSFFSILLRKALSISLFCRFAFIPGGYRRGVGYYPCLELHHPWPRHHPEPTRIPWDLLNWRRMPRFWKQRRFTSESPPSTKQSYSTHLILTPHLIFI